MNMLFNYRFPVSFLVSYFTFLSLSFFYKFLYYNAFVGVYYYKIDTLC